MFSFSFSTHSTLVEQSGPLIWVIFGLTLVGLYCSLERMFFFYRASINVTDLLVGLNQHVQRKAYAEALHEAARAPGPVARVAHAALLRYYLPRRDLRDIAHEAGQLEVPRIEKNLRTILGIAILAPLVGLLGTMVGMIQTMQLMNEVGSMGHPSELNTGVFTALIISICGMLVSVPMYLSYLYFMGRAKRLVHRIERAGIEMVHMISDVQEDLHFKAFKGELELHEKRHQSSIHTK